MGAKLFGSAMLKFFSGLALMMLLLFLPAGTLRWFEGWLLIGILFVPMFLAGLVRMAKSPELLQKRLNAKEEQGEQGLQGYAAYKQRVKYRLLPGIW